MPSPARKPLLPEAAAFIHGEAPAAPVPAAVAPATAAAEDPVRFTVDLPRPLHKRLKQAALDRDQPMTALAREILAGWLDSQT